MPVTEVNLFGVYVSPVAVLVVFVWGAVFALRLVLTRLDAFRNVWHPALLMSSVYVSALSLAVLAAVYLS